MNSLAPEKASTHSSGHCFCHLGCNDCGLSTAVDSTTTLPTFADLAETPAAPIRSVSRTTVWDEYSLSDDETDSASIQSEISTRCRSSLASSDRLHGSPKRPRHYVSSGNFRALGSGVPFQSHHSLALAERRTRPQGLARSASAASLLPIQQPPVEDDDYCYHIGDDGVPELMHQPKINPHPEHKAACPPQAVPRGPVQVSDPEYSSPLSGEMTVHSVSMTVGDVFELNLCTEIPTRLKITQIQRRT